MRAEDDFEHLAVKRDARLVGPHSRGFDEPKKFTQLYVWIRQVLTRHARDGKSVERLLTYERGSNGVFVVICGERDGAQYVRKDGVSCNFRFVLLEDSAGLDWHTYVLHVNCGSEGQLGPQYLRWELQMVRKPKVTAIVEPLSHLHPGTKRLRIPAPVLSARELVSMFLSMPPREEWY